MSDHIDRMETEHRELKERTQKLNAFIHGNEIFKTLGDIEQAKMIKQAGFMESYLSVLDSRLWVAKSQ